jgi:glycosyltransferase involved in cell wall biosynthesis/ubiquinone/menaquinone biosynthesis C-methylase UbiE
VRFLILTQYFPPEVGAPQVRLSAFARELKRMGHEVEVMTGLPNHPTGRIFPKYRGRFYLKEEWEGIPVHRVWLYPSTGAGLKRMLNYLSFALTSLWGLSKAQRPDYIFVESPPLFLSLPAWLASRFWRVPFIFNVADLWPDSVKELGLMSNRLLLRIAEWLESWCYRQAAYITAVTEGIRDALVNQKHVPIQKLLFLPNGVDSTAFQVTPPQEKTSFFGFNQEWFYNHKVFLYAGTIGFAQCLEVVVGAAESLLKENMHEITFMLVGDGSARNELEQLVARKQLSNVTFVNPVPYSEIIRLYCFAYAGLVSLCNKPLFEGARPSKILTIMASGKPVIYSGSGEGARLVEEARAGLVVPPEDPQALAEAVKKLVENPALAEEFGRNGRKYVEENLSWEVLVRDWLRQLEERRSKNLSDNQEELLRIRRVYSDYAKNPGFFTKWDPQNPGNKLIVNEREQHIQNLLKQHKFWPVENLKVLDVGCGTGAILRRFEEWGAKPENLVGIDLIPERIKKAQELYPHMRFILGDAAEMDFPNSSFDLVVVSTVFSSILNNHVAHTIAGRIWHVLRPGGAVLWYDFRYNNPKNPNVRGITRREIRKLFPHAVTHLRRVTLLPPLARRLGRLAPWLYPALAQIPFLCTHWLGLLVKPEEGGKP